MNLLSFYFIMKELNWWPCAGFTLVSLRLS